MGKQSDRMASLAFGGLLSLAVCIGISRFVFTPILPFMEMGLGISKPDAGLIASANYLGYLLGALFGSRQNLPGSPRRWFLASMVTCTITTLAMGITTSFEVFLGLRLIAGVASALAMVFGSTLILNRLAARKRSGLAALHFAGVGTGIVLSSVLVIGIEVMDAGWRSMWIASGALSFALVPLIFYLVPPVTDATIVAVKGERLHYSRSLKALIFSYSLLGFGYIITATFLSTLVRQIPEVQWMQSYIWLIVGLSAIPSVAFWNWIAAYVGNRRSYTFAGFAMAAGVVASVLGEGPVILTLAAILLGGTFMGMTALGLVEARNMVPDHARQILAVMTLAVGIGQIAGPIFAGFLHGIFGDFVAASLVAAGGIVIGSLLVWRKPAKPASRQ
ncbi:YbfB/YjiJ family MFS transporter [Sneathiella sp. HT1-7]|uniref:YbfB/YjiJ family MFS transporter n=1 Tax=Sneathiella sp. HT1-7 TaxID=2887192 RepID=UPI001D14BAB5|nr:YbfB/YjiJ family MFS transporter [Sneathiella sp. HT1-7]MCC3305449.1 YbfB/YjiJ family MFS transporter [Sneathiella sp. HT1-7]